MSGNTFKVVTPGPDGDGATLDGDGNDRLFTDENAFGAPGLRFGGLIAVGIEYLPEVAVAMSQGDGLTLTTRLWPAGAVTSTGLMSASGPAALAQRSVKR